ncbi:hypothetical protein CLV35_1897 [Motilibacter peucedani]|uniref:Uncharacterized protein n=1 Tax=Motilibacter peucedani TaxID=598650 RepID=A0A420XQ60_9ACTN|nr:hypothetical protein [Motilibacter peucedani]RKS75431.1 hypothetical protein CLV35_1897 [Motilibacter peucedani]
MALIPRLDRNRSGSARALMVLTPVVPGREEALRTLLAALPRGRGRSPFAALQRTHFARWVVVDDFVTDPGQPSPDPLGGAYLVFTSNLDGPLDDYLDELASGSLSVIGEVWGHCVACPHPARGAPFKAYLEHNRIDTGYFYSAYPTATVADVRRALALRERMIRFVTAAQTMDSADVRALLLQEFG